MNCLNTAHSRSKGDIFWRWDSTEEYEQDDRVCKYGLREVFPIGQLPGRWPGPGFRASHRAAYGVSPLSGVNPCCLRAWRLCALRLPGEKERAGAKPIPSG